MQETPLPACNASSSCPSDAEDSSAVTAATRERTLLLVDDEVNVLNALTRLVRPDGYRLLRASSGEAGLELLATHRVGVIVSDQRMPGMNGVEFLRRAKQIHPETVRIVLSGYTELKSVTDAINEGAVYKFLTKPWDDELLRANILEAFQNYELRTENARLASELSIANQRLSRAKGVLEAEMANSVGVLRVSQEMFELLPIGAIGVDSEGWMVSANRRAEEILSDSIAGPLVGALATERLPVAIAGILKHALNGGTPERLRWRSPQGDDFEVWCQLMGAASASQGAMLALLPVSERRPA